MVHILQVKAWVLCVTSLHCHRDLFGTGQGRWLTVELDREAKVKNKILVLISCFPSCCCHLRPSSMHSMTGTKSWWRLP